MMPDPAEFDRYRHEAIKPQRASGDEEPLGNRSGMGNDLISHECPPDSGGAPVTRIPGAAVQFAASPCLTPNHLHALGRQLGRQREVSVLHHDFLALLRADELQKLRRQFVQLGTRLFVHIDVEESGDRITGVEAVFIIRLDDTCRLPFRPAAPPGRPRFCNRCRSNQCRTCPH